MLELDSIVVLVLVNIDTPAVSSHQFLSLATRITPDRTNPTRQLHPSPMKSLPSSSRQTSITN